MPKVLFVCTGNLCRSPIAETVLSHELIERTADGYWQVDSAGLQATPGATPTEESVQAMQEYGYDMREHRARKLDAGQVKAADLILVMTHDQKETIVRYCPEHAHKVYLLSEMVGQNFEISDPYGTTLMHYRNTAAQIIQLIKDGFTNILAQARKNKSQRPAVRAN